MKWFYYQRNALGRWQPMMSADRPSGKTSEGKKEISTITEIDEFLADFGLDQLALLYPCAADDKIGVSVKP